MLALLRAREAAREKQPGAGRFHAWMLGSRIRYASIKTAITFGIVLGLIALVDGPDALRQGLWFTILIAVVAFVLNAWVWYPRAKQKPTIPPPTR